MPNRQLAAWYSGSQITGRNHPSLPTPKHWTPTGPARPQKTYSGWSRSPPASPLGSDGGDICSYTVRGPMLCPLPQSLIAPLRTPHRWAEGAWKWEIQVLC